MTRDAVDQRKPFIFLTTRFPKSSIHTAGLGQSLPNAIRFGSLISRGSMRQVDPKVKGTKY